MMQNAQQRRNERWITFALAVVILIPSLYGFAGKFIEFYHVFRGQADGGFAIAPMANYLLASAGFLCLFVWSTTNGMWGDMEQPKYELLRHEAQLDQADQAR